MGLMGKKAMFCVLVYTSLCVNFDGGALPPILDKIQESLGVPPAQQGMLGGFVYVGLTLACPLIGPLFQRFPTRLVLCVALSLNVFCCFLFALSPSRLPAFISRFGVGFTQSAVVVYNPVWVDYHAPRRYATTWLSFVQASAPLGIMLGYCLSGYLCQVFLLSWRVAFFIQSFALIPSVVTLLFAPGALLSISDQDKFAELDDDEDEDEGVDDAADQDKGAGRDVEGDKPAVEMQQVHLDTGRGRSRSVTMMVVEGMSHINQHDLGVQVAREMAEEEEEEQGEGNAQRSSRKTEGEGDVERKPKLVKHSSMPFQSEPTQGTEPFLKQLGHLLASKLFVWVVLALSALYFVVTTIQYWVTVYLIKVIGAPEVEVLTAFAVTSITAPIMGVLVGGMYIDRMGGYTKFAQCLKILTIFAALAFASSVPAGFVHSFWLIIVLLWVCLFFGGAILAPATGIVLSSVDKEYMPLASSISMLVYNLLGYAGGPIVTGVVYQYYGMIWCIRVGLLSGVLGFVCLLLAWASAIRMAKQNPNADKLADTKLQKLTTHNNSFFIGQ